MVRIILIFFPFGEIDTRLPPSPTTRLLPLSSCPPPAPWILDGGLNGADWRDEEELTSHMLTPHDRKGTVTPSVTPTLMCWDVDRFHLRGGFCSCRFWTPEDPFRSERRRLSLTCPCLPFPRDCLSCKGEAGREEGKRGKKTFVGDYSSQEALLSLPPASAANPSPP